MQTLLALPLVAQLMIGAMILSFIVFKVLPIVRQLRRAMGKFRKQAGGSTLDAERLTALSVGLINAEQLTATTDSLTTGIDAQRLSEGLAENWQITSQTSARQTIEWLLNAGHRALYPDALSILQSHEPADWQAVAASRSDQPEQLLSFIENLAETRKSLQDEGFLSSDKDLARGILAWDMARAITLARAAYDLRYMSESEAWTVIRHAAGAVFQEFSSWEELAKSYIIGRAMWAGESVMLDGLMTIARDCLTEGESPWKRLAWPGAQRS
jgi:Protein of unknown function (DUF1266)